MKMLLDLFSRNLIMDNTAKGCLTLFSELFTVIPCALKDFKLS